MEQTSEVKELPIELTIERSDKSIAERLDRGEKVEVFSTEEGFAISLGDLVVDNVREIHLVITTHSGSELKIRQRFGQGDVIEWKDFYLQGVKFYLQASKSVSDLTFKRVDKEG
jgi:hypothetical protein